MAAAASPTDKPPTGEPLAESPAGDFLVDTDVTADPGVEGRYRLDLSPAWNVFYAFGGITMAVALRAAERALDRDDLRPLTATALYVKPVSAGPVEIDVSVLRNGRTAAQATASLRNGGGGEGPALFLTTAFGQSHPSLVDYVDARFPDVPPPEACEPPPPQDDDSPFRDIPFHRQTDWRPTHPWDRDNWQPSTAEMSSWTRLLKEPRLPDGSIDPVSLCIPADILGSAVSQRVPPDQPWLVLTLELGLHFLQPTESAWVLQHTVAPHAGDGYASGHVFLWDDQRRLLGFATQRARMRAVDPGERFGPA
jgi:acyl-CoA thioesterase